MKKSLLLVLFIASVFSLWANRNVQWATPVKSTYVKNFYRVDNGIYRCAQPDKKAFAELEKLGIKEVLNLRNYHDDKEKAENTRLKLHRVKMNAGEPNYDDVLAALRIIKERKGDIVIHCWHGSDRTGLVVAMYRIVFQGWEKEVAIDELVNGNYGYHSIYKDILTFIRSVDIEKLKQDLMN